jgi:Ca2+-binding RTX toxin-like protein
VDDVASGSRGPSIDARKLEALEEFLGDEFRQYGNTPNPGPDAASLLNQTFDALVQYVNTQLLAQTHLAPILDGIEMTLDTDSWEIDYDFSAAVALLQESYNSDSENALAFVYALGSLLQEYGEIGEEMLTALRAEGDLAGDGFARLLAAAGSKVLEGSDGNDSLQGADGVNDWLRGGKGNDSLYGKTGDDLLEGNAGNDNLYGGNGADTLQGGSGDDRLSGDNDNDILDGNDGNDTLSGGAGDDQLTGGSGNDAMDGGAGNDRYMINAGDGADSISDYDSVAGNADTVVFGANIHAENITLFKTGSDLVLRLNDADSLTLKNWFSSTNYRIESFQFADGTILDARQLETLGAIRLDGSENNDSLSGSAISETNDILSGQGGNDNLSGYGGDDLLDGGAGNDNLYGGNGADTLLGGAGDDRLSGENGNDIIDGGAGNDTMDGGQGNDRYMINGGDGADSISDYDSVAGNADTVVFGANIHAENLTLFKTGSDLVLRLNDADSLTLKNWFSSTNYCIESFQFADGTILDARQLETLGAIRLDGSENNDSLFGSSISETNDILSGQGGNDNLSGYGGDDLLDGGAGNDNLYGGNGADILHGGLGADTLNGGAGDDIFLFNRGDGADSINADDATGFDTLRFGLGIELAHLRLEKSGNYDLLVKIGDGPDQITLKSWFSNPTYRIDQFEFADGTKLSANQLIETLPIYGSETNDSLTGNDGVADHLIGMSGNDTISGRSGDDRIEGGDGNDTLNGEAGNDTLSGGLGADTLLGGAGDDIFLFNRGDGADSINADDATGFNTLRFGLGIELWHLRLEKSGNYDLLVKIGDGPDQITLKSWFSNPTYRIDQFEFADGTKLSANQLIETLPIYGSEINDSMYGNDGVADHLIGMSGNDIIYGRSGDDRIEGGDGNDTLNGEAGNDTLHGGLGADTLNGGAGNDVFRFTVTSDSDALSGIDLITDFARGFDMLDFSQFDTDSTQKGVQGFTCVVDGEFDHELSGGQLRFSFKASTNTGTLYGKTADGDQFAVDLRGVKELTDADIIGLVNATISAPNSAPSQVQSDGTRSEIATETEDDQTAVAEQTDFSESAAPNMEAAEVELAGLQAADDDLVFL